MLDNRPKKSQKMQKLIFNFGNETILVIFFALYLVKEYLHTSSYPWFGEEREENLQLIFAYSLPKSRPLRLKVKLTMSNYNSSTSKKCTVDYYYLIWPAGPWRWPARPLRQRGQGRRCHLVADLVNCRCWWHHLLLWLFLSWSWNPGWPGSWPCPPWPCCL